MAPAIQTTSQPTTISAFIPAGDTAQWAKTLKHMAALIKSATKKNYCLPVLGCAHLAPHPDGIAVSVTDLKIGHTAVLPGILGRLSVSRCPRYWRCSPAQPRMCTSTCARVAPRARLATLPRS